MGRKIGFADFGYGVTSTAVVLQAKRLNTQYSAAHVRQLLILYHGAKPHGILAVFSVVPQGTRKRPQKSGIITALRLLYHSCKSRQTCTPPMRRKISFADFCYGVTSTAVALQAKRLNAQHPAAYVRQLLILYHDANAAWYIGRVFGCPTRDEKTAAKSVS